MECRSRTVGVNYFEHVSDSSMLKPCRNRPLSHTGVCHKSLLMLFTLFSIMFIDQGKETSVHIVPSRLPWYVKQVGSLDGDEMHVDLRNSQRNSRRRKAGRNLACLYQEHFVAPIAVVFAFE